MRHKLMLTALLALLFVSGCANQDAADLGSLLGRTLGKPVGVVATAIDETFQTTGDIMSDNPRYQRAEQQVTPATPAANNKSHYYQAQVLIKTQGPAQIEALNLEASEDVSAFWR